MRDQFTIFVLLYGNYPDLAARCLNSIVRACYALVPHGIRIGCNAISPATESYIKAMVKGGWLQEKNIYRSPQNLHKYPVMRQMFYDAQNPISTPFTMWFDDDSFIKTEMATAAPDFLTRVHKVMTTAAPGRALPMICGSPYTLQLEGHQRQWVSQQFWYRGEPITTHIPFITGGWWTADTARLHAINYPFPELDHRGGDVMLGVCCQQQGWRIVKFRDGLAINADAEGRESRSPRRGFDQAPIGVRKMTAAATTFPPMLVGVPEPVEPLQPAAGPRKIVILEL
jgi:hypothetical protein